MTSMDQDVRKLVEELHAHPALVIVTATGAGSLAISWLLGVAGASRTVLEANVPYASSSTVDYIGFEPKEFASLEVASALAESARSRSIKLASNSSEKLIGLGCAAAIATDRTRKGDHCAFVSVDIGNDEIITHTLNLKKGARDRDDEENLVSRLILNCLAAASGLNSRIDLPLLAGEQVITDHARTKGTS